MIQMNKFKIRIFSSNVYFITTNRPFYRDTKNGDDLEMLFKDYNDRYHKITKLLLKVIYK